MTREEAIEILLDMANDLQIFPGSKQGQTFNMAIEALNQQTCEDCISRDAVHDMLENIPYLPTDKWFNWLQKACLRLAELPPVYPKQNEGHWYIDERPESDREIICSNCEQPVFKYHKLDFDYRPKYCPNCGAKMNGGD